MARHHSSRKREHITKHDRMVDRENLMHGKHKDGHHMMEYGEHHKMHHMKHYNSKHKAHHDPNHMPDEFNDESRRDKDRSGDMGFDPRYAMRANMNEFYAGMDARRRQEMEDAGMIHEDQRAIANLPQEVMIKAYPVTGPYLPEGLDDTQRGINMQMDYDDSQRAKHFYPKKV